MADEVGRENKGFSGLSSMVSNVAPVEAIEEDLTDEEEGRNNAVPQRITVKQERDWSGTLQFVREWIGEKKGGLIVLAIFAGIWLISTWPSTPTNTANPTNTATSVKTSPKFEKPPIGTTTFNTAQIRWALREKIRLETINKYISSDAAIDAYNLMVDDYNRRAGHFKYYQSDMDQAQRDVNSMLSEITAEAIADARKL